MSQGTDLWKKAKQLIPGGNQLLSKRPEMFLPNQWPSYFKSAKGVSVWDLDNQKFTDMSIMGMGTCVLGYANGRVNKAVIQAITAGSMATLNSYEEVELAEKLIKIHPWAEQAKFARTGGEACAIAVRIARTASGKDKVAFCGYHGWHDWYLSANLSDKKNLNGHLLPGLASKGIPRALSGTALPFHYGDIKGFKSLLSQHEKDLGVVMMEVQRDKEIDLPFIQEIRRLTKEKGIVLVFDEVSSGFRVNTGGIHLRYKLEPDMAVLGKALGNGFPITTVIGTKAVMESAQDTFISSTYWTERIGFVAGLSVVDQFEKEKVGDYLTEVGNYLIKGFNQITTSHGLNIKASGIPAAPHISFQEKDPLAVKTLFTQEMLKKGFLASTVIYVSSAHTREIIDGYLDACNDVFSRIKTSKLEGPICASGFKRLT